ncbi:hypothetical protein JYK02_03415 [Corallococcus macrosporus]|uniref:DUF58 domain-containing protein n=1 Tax=Corallococcus macrosporus TaxID=35 RepID=A0ABS3D4G0_9BACT|nr:hypothetical protein [Corallococcus macrosporus]MBN8226553.1 hypothetical protein [Corallococcus macrosporus]
MSHPLPLEPASLVALRPAPATLAPGVEPPWPPPVLRVEPKLPEAYARTSNDLMFGLLALGLGALAYTQGHPVVGVGIGLCGLAAVLNAARLLGREGAEHQRQRHLQAEHLRRARLTWARVEQAAIVGSVHRKGMVTGHELALDVVPWHAAGPTARVSLRVTVSIGTAGHVVPGAYLGVLSDPQEPWAVPQCVLTLDGAQLPL